MEKIGSRKLDYKKIAEGFSFNSEKEALDFVNDGRIMGRVGEFWQGNRQKENSPFDVTDEEGNRGEVRSITKQVSFASSKEVGFGRSVTEEGFNQKLNSLDNYLLLDLRNIEKGDIDIIKVTKDEVLELPLRQNKSISAEKFYEIYDGNK